MKTKSELKNRSWIRFNKTLVSQEATGLKQALAMWLMAMSAVAAFGQGKVSLAMDLPITMHPEWLLPWDMSLAGQPVPTSGPLPSGIILSIGLYGGTSSASLSLISSETINPNGGTGLPAGAFTRLNIVCPFGGGVFQYFQVKLWDAIYSSYEAQALAGHVNTGTDYSNFNHIFQMIPGTNGVTYPQIYNGGSTTWTAVGNEDVNALLVMSIIPEPPTFALGALGAAALALRLRRRTHSSKPQPISNL